MHPTVFQLDAFGKYRLPAAQTRAVLRHLRAGCARCRVALARFLIPWLDDDAASEARAAEPAAAGRQLQAAYLQAAERAARAAANLRSRPPSDRRVRRALAIFRAEGIDALGRLPHHLLGRPAVEALLHLSRTRGLADPRLRLRLVELACDLAGRLRAEQDDERRLRDLRCRACIELATVYRLLGDHRGAQQQVNQAADDLLRGEHDPLVEAHLLRAEASLIGDQFRLKSALAGLAAVLPVYRQCAQPAELANALISYGIYASFARDFDVALERYQEALTLVDIDREPVLAVAAVGNSCDTLLMRGRWREGLALLRQSRPLIERSPSVMNAARFARLEGRLLKFTGDTAGATRAFAASRRAFETFGKKYVAGAVILDQAAALERQGEAAGAQALVLKGTDMLLELEPHREVYLAMMMLRTTSQFAATRPALPLDRVIRFLDRAEFNPSIRLETLLD